VEQRIGTVAYKLTLPEESRIHPVFHVSQLKPFVPSYAPIFSELPKPPDLLSATTSPAAILERRMVKKGDQALLSNSGFNGTQLPVDAATWEDYDVLRARFPDAAIWEGSPSEERGNVTTDNTIVSV
jgi:hypothetical protein